MDLTTTYYICETFTPLALTRNVFIIIYLVIKPINPNNNTAEENEFRITSSLDFL